MFTRSEIELSWEQVSRGGPAPGVDGIDMPAFTADLDAQLDALTADLQTQRYQPQPYRVIEVQKNSGGTRRIAIATLRDRVVQTAALQQLTPILEPHLTPACYSYRTGIGVHDALEAVAAIRDNGWRWGICADIARFFESVPHAPLLHMLNRYGIAADLIKMIHRWLTTPFAIGGLHEINSIGLPQGLPLSPLLSNVYLIPFDREMLQNQWALVRYADDMAIFFPHPAWADECEKEMEESLDALRLSLAREKTKRVSFEEGFEFLGARFHKNELIPALPHPYEKDQTPPPRKERPAPIQTIPHVEMRTLYLQEQGSTLSINRGRFVIFRKDEKLMEVHTHNIEQIFIFGRVQISTAARSYCLTMRIPVCLFSSYGKYFGILRPADDIPVALRRAQFNLADNPDARLHFAQKVVANRIRGEQKLLQQHTQNYPDSTLNEMITRLYDARQRIKEAESLDQLRGMEGAAAAAFFHGFGLCQRGPFTFKQRLRRPPTDPLNSMLSFAYTLTFYNILSYLHARRLDPGLGMYHEPRTGHPALASDLAEEFRAPITEKLVLSLANRNQFGPEDFTFDVDNLHEGNKHNPPCRLTDDARKRFLAAYEEHLLKKVPHPDTVANVTWRRVMDLQVLRMRRWVEGAVDSYEPYEGK